MEDSNFLQSKKLLFLIIFLLTHFIIAQELSTMHLEEIGRKEGIQLIVRDPNEAILVVHSTITKLSFESNNVIKSVKNPEPGEYRLHLRPGTHIITFKAEEYLPIKKRFYIPKKDYREVKITAEKPDKSVEMEYGDIKVATKPEGASINLDGLKIKGKTPKIFRDQLAKKHNITLRLGNYYEPIDTTIQVQPDTLNVFEFTMQPKSTESEGDYGGMQINTSPKGAIVRIDGIEVRGKTPLSLEKQKAGHHRVNLSLSSKYKAIDTTVYIAGGEQNTFDFNFQKKKYGDLKLVTTPNKAIVELDGIPVNGQTPLTFKNQKAGAHKIRLLQKKTFPERDTTILVDEIDTTVNIRGGELNKYNFTFNIGDLKIKTKPSDANITIDGFKLAEKTPAMLENKLTGKHSLRLETDNKYIDTAVTVNTNDTSEYNFDLKWKTGYLSLHGYPAESKIRIDNRRVNNKFLNITSNDIIELKKGKHAIFVNKNGYHNNTANISIGYKDTITKQIKLKKKSPLRGILYSTVLPGSGQIYYGSENKGTLIAMSTVGLSGGLFFLNRIFKRKYKKYNKYVDEYENASSLNQIEIQREKKESTLKELKNLKKYAYITSGTLGAIWLYSIIDTGLSFITVKNDKIVMSASPRSIHFSIKF